MKKLLYVTLMATSLGLCAHNVMAQKIKLEEGSLDALKGTHSLNVKYEYHDMTVGKKTEAEYVADKKEDYNKKEEGKGDKWGKAWIADREDRYEVQFKEEFEKQSDMKIGDRGGKYTLIFKTSHIEPGFNIGITKKNAEIDGEAWIVETAKPDHVIAKLSVERCPGRTFGGGDYDTGVRIQESYAVAGKGLGKYLRKELN